jgi:hypothetical protein
MSELLTEEEENKIYDDAVNSAFTEIQNDSCSAGEKPEFNIIEPNKIKLTDDCQSTRPKDQVYGVVSQVGPYKIDEDEKETTAIKIRGVYKNLEDAEKAAKNFVMLDKFFECSVIKLGCWFEVPFNFNNTDDVKYPIKRLDDIMARFKTDKEKDTSAFTDRMQLQKKLS